MDLITAFSSDGRIAALDLVTLGDPRRALPSYEAVLLVSPRRARDAAVHRGAAPLLGAISVDRMRQANLMVDRDTDKRTPAEAAAGSIRRADVAASSPVPLAPSAKAARATRSCWPLRLRAA